MQWLLDRMNDTPAYVRNARTDALAANALGRTLYAPIFAMPKPNLARFVFLDAAVEPRDAGTRTRRRRRAEPTASYRTAAIASLT